ncbi:MAG TPA: HNH endonuclease signature motif containing protein, partial [Mycobacteriales bacterium]|nr:HNH endonuclease signature motif containing protein [Mycobacteriales bacterium]
ISRVLLDSTGQVRGLEALRDTVTPSQRRALTARDGGCAARGCTRPPAMCDAHHLIARADDGPTELDNLVLLCRRHHVLWHLGKLRLRHLHVPWRPDARASGADPPW